MITALTVVAATPAQNTGSVLPAGVQGASAYQLAVANGFVGTEAQWLASLAVSAKASALTDVIETIRAALTATSLEDALGQLNALDRRIHQAAADPSSEDVPADTLRIHKNTATGRIGLWVSDGGTLVDLLAPKTFE